LRVLDGVIAAVGLTAALLLVVVLRQGEAHPKARVAVQNTQLVAPRAVAVKATASRRVAAVALQTPTATPRPVAVEPTPPPRAADEAPRPAETAVEGTPANAAAPGTTPATTGAAPTSAPMSVVPDDKTAAAGASTGASPSPQTVTGSEPPPAAEPTHVKKRKRKKVDHTPPTASFPDP
jgi:hypothetical protein